MKSFTFDEARNYSFNVRWKVETCFSGEKCWCRIVVPENPISFKEEERKNEEEFQIISDGAVDKETAEYIVKIHNERIETIKQKRLDALQKLSDLDQELGFA
jgi:hypothetical protein